MQIFIGILRFMLISAILLGTLFLGRKFLFPKIKINKYIPLILSIIAFIASIFLNIFFILVSVLFFVWFLDIQQNGQIQKEKKINIKPKAKPNRVKNRNNIKTK